MKSGSGILFSSGTSFESCQLCVQARCPGRRAAYSRELARRLLDSPVEEKNTGQKGSPGQKGIFQR
ncbi:MAG: hypothetical protein A2Z29_08845 [Chloroflexi bacterium RBG_16_56_11]|nr:MAG: hypothetical protein A2Z29_08845 [Chloroflexi bacterium RBG_16_56_11]